MAVISVVGLELKWCKKGDRYHMRLFDQDGLVLSADIAGSLWEAHSPQIRGAMAERRANIADIVPLPLGRKRDKH